MTTYFSMYGPAHTNVAGLRLKPPSNIFECDHSDMDGDEQFVLCQPPYTVTRDKALFLTGLREDIISGLRRGNIATITVVEGAKDLTVDKGSSGAAKAARTALGAVQGSVATALTAVLSTPEGIQKAVRNTFVGGTPKLNPLNAISPSSQRKQHIARQQANLNLAVVKVSSIARNGRGNALLAAMAGNNNGNDAGSSNSVIMLHVLATELQERYGF